jgi:hypothetical protein
MKDENNVFKPHSPVPKGRKKFGGRQKGTPNKEKALIRVFCSYLVEDGYCKFKEELNSLNGKDYVFAFIQLAKLFSTDTSRIMANKKLLDLFEKELSMTQKATN